MHGFDLNHAEHLGAFDGWQAEEIAGAVERGQLAQLSFILVSCAIAVSMFRITRGIALLRIEGRVDGTVQAAIWDRLLALPVAFFANYTAGDLATRSLGINAIRSILTGATVTAVLGCLFASFNILLMFWYDSELAKLAMVLCGIALLIAYWVSRIQVKYQRRVRVH